MWNASYFNKIRWILETTPSLILISFTVAAPGFHLFLTGCDPLKVPCSGLQTITLDPYTDDEMATIAGQMFPEQMGLVKKLAPAIKLFNKDNRYFHHSNSSFDQSKSGLLPKLHQYFRLQ